MIEAEELTKTFGDLVAVDRLTFRIAKGEVFGFLGPNGAGKTTTVRMLAGLISKTSGRARVAGFEVGDPKDALALRRSVGFLPENVGLYDELSARANLEFFGRLYDRDGPELQASIERLLRLLGLWEERERPVRTFSKGMKQKVALARALVHDPPVLFLDEPTANLDPEATRTVRDAILRLKGEGTTVFLTTHNLDEAQRTCDRIGILHGHLVTVGTPEELTRRLPSRRTEIELARAGPDLLARIAHELGGRTFELKGTTLYFEVADPVAENPRLVGAVVAAGAEVVRVGEGGALLEEAYLNIVHEGGS